MRRKKLWRLSTVELVGNLAFPPPLRDTQFFASLNAFPSRGHRWNNRPRSTLSSLNVEISSSSSSSAIIIIAYQIYCVKWIHGSCSKARLFSPSTFRPIDKNCTRVVPLRYRIRATRYGKREIEDYARRRV